MATPQSEADVDRDGRSAWGCAACRGRGARVLSLLVPLPRRAAIRASRAIFLFSRPPHMTTRVCAVCHRLDVEATIRALSHRWLSARVFWPQHAPCFAPWLTRPVRVAKRRTRTKRCATRSAAPLGRETRDGVLGSRLTCARPRRHATGSRASLRSPRGARHRARRSTAAGLVGSGAH